jgi:predicted RNase H-like HicB family nuclease
MAVMRRKNPASVAEVHVLNALEFLRVEMWWEDESRAWVTRVPVLNGISDFGKTEEEALDRTATMILVALDGMEEDGVKPPFTTAQVRQIREALVAYR